MNQVELSVLVGALAPALRDSLLVQVEKRMGEWVERMRPQAPVVHNQLPQTEVHNHQPPAEVKVLNEFKAPDIHSPVQVVVDMTPVADAIDRLGEKFIDSLKVVIESQTRVLKTVQHLTEVLAEAPVPINEFKPELTLVPSEVVVNNLPGKSVVRRPRYKVEHSDGSVSRLVEEE